MKTVDFTRPIIAAIVAGSTVGVFATLVFTSIAKSADAIVAPVRWDVVVLKQQIGEIQRLRDDIAILRRDVQDLRLRAEKHSR